MSWKTGLARIGGTVKTVGPSSKAAEYPRIPTPKAFARPRFAREKFFPAF